MNDAELLAYLKREAAFLPQNLADDAVGMAIEGYLRRVQRHGPPDTPRAYARACLENAYKRLRGNVERLREDPIAVVGANGTEQDHPCLAKVDRAQIGAMLRDQLALLTPQQLEAARAVVEQGNLREAGLALGISHTAVAKRLRAGRERLGLQNGGSETL